MMRLSVLAKQRLNRLPPILSAGILLLFLLLLSGCREASPAPTLRERASRPRLQVLVAEAGPLGVNVPVEFVGNLLPRRRTLIVAQVDGVIRAIPASDAKIDVVVDGKQYTESLGVLPGQPVRAGQVLIELDPTDHELALAMAKSKLAKEQAELQRILAGQRNEEIERLRAVRDEMKSRYELALSERDRTRSLFEKQAVSQSEYDLDLTEVATARAILAGAEATLQAAVAGPTPEEIAVAKATVTQAETEVHVAEENLSKTTIRAPYDGVVTDVYTEVGGKVSAAAASQLMELLDLRYLVAEVGVSESFLGQITMQDRAELVIAGAANGVPAIVVAINGKVEPDTRTFRVRLAMDNSEGRFKAGQFAIVRFDISSSDALIAVPTSAISFVEGLPHVFTYRDGHVNLRAVTLGLEGTQYTEVRSGVEAGELVVTRDPAMLTDGMPVQIRASENAHIARQTTHEEGAL